MATDSSDWVDWLQMVCNGDVAAARQVLTASHDEDVVSVRLMLNALGQAGHAVDADWKDDDTVAGQCSDMAQGRGLGAFESPLDDSSEGVQTDEVLLAFGTWLQERGFSLVHIDLGDDAVHAVAAVHDRCPEFEALSRRLGLTVRIGAGE